MARQPGAQVGDPEEKGAWRQKFPWGPCGDCHRAPRIHTCFLSSRGSYKPTQKLHFPASFQKVAAGGTGCVMGRGGGEESHLGVTEPPAWCLEQECDPHSR